MSSGMLPATDGAGHAVISRDLANWFVAHNIVKAQSLRPASAAAAARFGRSVQRGAWLALDDNGIATLLQGAAILDALWAFTRGHGAPVNSGAVYSNTAHARAANWTRVHDLLSTMVGVRELATDDARELWLCGDVESVLLLSDRLRLALPNVVAAGPQQQRKANDGRGKVKSHPATHGAAGGAAAVRADARRMVQQPRGGPQRQPPARTPEPRRLAPLPGQTSQAAPPWQQPPNATDPGAVASQVTQLATLLLQQQQLHLALQHQQQASFAREQQQLYQGIMLGPNGGPPPPVGAHQHQHVQMHVNGQQQQQHHHQPVGNGFGQPHPAAVAGAGLPAWHPAAEQHSRHPTVTDPAAASSPVGGYQQPSSQQRHSTAGRQSASTPPPPFSPNARWSALSTETLESRELRRQGLDPVPRDATALDRDIAPSSNESTPHRSRGGEARPGLKAMPVRGRANDSDAEDDDEAASVAPLPQPPATRSPDAMDPPPAATSSPSAEPAPTDRRAALDSQQLRRLHDVAEARGEAFANDMRTARPQMTAHAGRDELMEHPLYTDGDWLMADVDQLRRQVLWWWRSATQVVERTAFLRWLRWALRRATARRKAQHLPPKPVAVRVQNDDAPGADAAASSSSPQQPPPGPDNEEAPVPSVQKAKGNRRSNQRTAEIVEDLAMVRKRQRRQMTRAAAYIMRMANVKLYVLYFRQWLAWHYLVRDERPLLVPSRAVVTPRGRHDDGLSPPKPDGQPEDRIVVAREPDATAQHQFPAVAENRSAQRRQPTSAAATTAGGSGRTCGTCGLTVTDSTLSWCPGCGDYLPAEVVPVDDRREDHWRLTLEYDRLDVISRFDKRSPVVLSAVNLLQRILRGMHSERHVSRFGSARFHELVGTRRLMNVCVFVVVAAAKFSLRRRGKVIRFVLENRSARWKQELAVLGERHPELVARRQAYSGVPQGCTCLRCATVLTGTRLRVLRALTLQRVVNIEAREVREARLEAAMIAARDADASGYRAAVDTVEADIERAARYAPLRREALAQSDSVITTCDTQFLCVKGRKAQLVREEIRSRQKSAMRSLGIVCRILHFVAKLLQQPWPIKWRDSRALTRDAAAAERHSRAGVEIEEAREWQGQQQQHAMVVKPKPRLPVKKTATIASPATRSALKPARRQPSPSTTPVTGSPLPAGGSAERDDRKPHDATPDEASRDSPSAGKSPRVVVVAPPATTSDTTDGGDGVQGASDGAAVPPPRTRRLVSFATWAESSDDDADGGDVAANPQSAADDSAKSTSPVVNRIDAPPSADDGDVKGAAETAIASEAANPSPTAAKRRMSRRRQSLMLVNDSSVRADVIEFDPEASVAVVPNDPAKDKQDPTDVVPTASTPPPQSPSPDPQRPLGIAGLRPVFIPEVVAGPAASPGAAADTRRDTPPAATPPPPPTTTSDAAAPPAAQAQAQEEEEPASPLMQIVTTRPSDPSLKHDADGRPADDGPDAAHLSVAKPQRHGQRRRSSASASGNSADELQFSTYSDSGDASFRVNDAPAPKQAPTARRASVSTIDSEDGSFRI